jgi:hypothetical protein
MWYEFVKNMHMEMDQNDVIHYYQRSERCRCLLWYASGAERRPLSM